MDAEELIRRGEQARLILESEDTMFFFRDELERIKQASFNTQPEEGKLRSELYYRHHALSEFINSLKAYQTAAEELLAELKAKEQAKEID